MNDHEERVRRRAYQLWQQEGCPEGRAQMHWEKARELVAIEENKDPTLKPVREPEIGPAASRSNPSKRRKMPATLHLDRSGRGRKLSGKTE